MAAAHAEAYGKVDKEKYTVTKCKCKFGNCKKACRCRKKDLKCNDTCSCRGLCMMGNIPQRICRCDEGKCKKKQCGCKLNDVGCNVLCSCGGICKEVVEKKQKSCKCNNNKCGKKCGCKGADRSCTDLCRCKAQCNLIYYVQPPPGPVIYCRPVYEQSHLYQSKV